MGGMLGKHYQATKDFLHWNDLDVKKWTPIILRMGKIWASTINSKNK